jgi:mannose-6-phosphate isomerase-like protein (cupin superfamily)
MGRQIEIDNDKVRVARWSLGPGEETSVHRHEYAYVVVPLTHATMLVTSPDGSGTTNELTPGCPYFREAGAEHNVSNAGVGVLDFVEVEVRA